MLGALEGVHWIMASLLYGAGLRLLECLRLRGKDLDFSSSQIVVHAGKGRKDRRTMLPAIVQEPLAAHQAHVRRLHEQDLAQGFGSVYMPDPLRRKYPHGDRAWG